MILSFEGGEGAGKSTQAALLKSCLENKGKRVVSLREPGGSALSENIRNLFLEYQMDAMTELMLVLASRYENIKTIILPAVRAGSTVIIDRFIDSTIVYQGITGGLGIETVRQLMKISGTYYEPDLTFLLDIKPEAARLRYSPSDRIENKDSSYHAKLRQGFLDICNEKRHVVIDAEKSIDEILEIIIKRTVIETD